eukprot:jgi/Bigna1/85367/estExt_fgenesh1_pg.C_30371
MLRVATGVTRRQRQIVGVHGLRRSFAGQSKLPGFQFPPEEEEVIKEREAKFEEELEVMKLEEEERIAKDKEAIEANKEILEESKKFANRGKSIEFSSRPFDSREDDPNPLSPDTMDLSEDILDKIVTDARKLPSSYLQGRLLSFGGDGQLQMEDPNLQDHLLAMETNQKKRVKGAVKSVDEEFQTFFDIKEQPKLDEEIREKFNLDLYDNIDKLLSHEEWDREVAEKRMTDFKEATKKSRVSDDDTIRGRMKDTLPKRQKAIATKQEIPYSESFTADGDIDPRFKEDRAAFTEEPLDTFASTPAYDEFDEFRIKYGMNLFDEKDDNPFAPLEAHISSSGSSESDHDWDLEGKLHPVQITADTLRVSGPTQEVLWHLNTKDKDRFTPKRLAQLFELRPIVVKDIIEMKEEEKQMIKNGEETTGLEWWFMADIGEYNYMNGDYVELPYTQFMNHKYADLDEKKSHRHIDEIEIEKYREWDNERLAFERTKRKTAQEVEEFAGQIVAGKELDLPRKGKSRYTLTVTDLSLKKKNMFRVWVREKQGVIRNATKLERGMAIREERPAMQQQDEAI